MFTLITANRPLCGNGPLQFSIFDDIHEHLVLGSLHVVFVFENSQLGLRSPQFFRPVAYSVSACDLCSGLQLCGSRNLCAKESFVITLMTL